MIRHVIEDLCRRQSVALEHQVDLAHVFLPASAKPGDCSPLPETVPADASTVMSVLRTPETIVGTGFEIRRDRVLRKHAEHLLNATGCAAGATACFMC
jgi:hypothetical protein